MPELVAHLPASTFMPLIGSGPIDRDAFLAYVGQVLVPERRLARTGRLSQSPCRA